MTAAPKTVGVLGAGTMGAGIAQLAAQAGARTLLHDPAPGAFEKGTAGVRAALDKRVQRGKLDASAAEATLGRIVEATDVLDLAACGLVIEAVPERLDLKLELLNGVADVVSPECVLATNTSSLSVTEIAAGIPNPERVVGMHFFNPAPVMRLVEVVAGLASSERALATTRALGEAMGKHVIDAADVPGFLVNRVNRPFFLESLLLVQEGVASVDQVDRILRMAAGYRMGPFELMDLVGIETNHAVAVSFQRQTFGEPRYQPSLLAARKVVAGHLGRKSGRGWFEYPAGRPQDPVPPDGGGGAGRVVTVRGALPVADDLRAAARGAGFTIEEENTDRTWLALDLTGRPGPAAGTAPRALSVHAGSLHETEPAAAGFHVLAPLGSLIETTRTERTDERAAARLSEFVSALGRIEETVTDAAGLVSGRVVAQLANEAAFLVGEGNGTEADVEIGMELGLNHPRGPFAWLESNGAAHLGGLLDALRAESGEPRYRLAPLLRRHRALAG